MKRLIRKSSGVELSVLDEADVENDRCPKCKNKKLERSDGFKYCNICETGYKLYDGKAFVTFERDI